MKIPLACPHPTILAGQNRTAVVLAMVPRHFRHRPLCSRFSSIGTTSSGHQQYLVLTCGTLTTAQLPPSPRRGSALRVVGRHLVLMYGPS